MIIEKLLLFYKKITKITSIEVIFNMKKAKVFFNNKVFVGTLTEEKSEQHYKRYVFEYDVNYNGPPVSLTMPIIQKVYCFNHFPAYFEGVLPEGHQLQALLYQRKLDHDDYFAQLMYVGNDLVGAFTVKEDNYV